MYSDNETDTDLLGFEDVVHNLVDLVTNPDVLPVTAGVLADWGSGKSSLLMMVAKELRSQGVVVVEFSPWRIETYDDAKTAFLSAVVEQVADQLPEELPAEAEPKAKQALKAAREQLSMLRRRVKWMRVAGLAAKHLVTMTAPSIEELDSILKDEKEAENQPSTESVSRDFRDEFEMLVAGLQRRTVVVLVDDLDRSLPEQVPEILQAIRLFLSVEGTAFILATDERVVRDAIRLRYPQAAMSSETDLPAEYLEKIVQVPVRIPPVGPAEAESYLNLLVAQRHFDDTQMKACLAKAKSVRATGNVSVSMNLGLAREAVGNVGEDAEREFALMGRVARSLAIGLKGNPRQLKRYLNGLEMRWSTAERRGLALDRAVLAKLMVLEYAEPNRYKELHRWSNDSKSRRAIAHLEGQARTLLGIVKPAPDTDTSHEPDPNGSSDRDAIQSREQARPAKQRELHSVPAAESPRETASETVTAKVSEDPTGPAGAQRTGKRRGNIEDKQQPSAAPVTSIPVEANRWLESDWESNWLALEPPLGDVDLAPYFELGRAALSSIAVRARALPERLQNMLERMTSPTTDVRDLAADHAAALEVAEATMLVDAAIDRLANDKNAGHLIQALATVTAKHPSLAPAFLRTIQGVPYDGLTAGVPRGLARRMGPAGKAAGIDDVLRAWAGQDINKPLARSSAQVLSGDL
jgi:hypothetical protein